MYGPAPAGRSAGLSGPAGAWRAGLSRMVIVRPSIVRPRLAYAYTRWAADARTDGRTWTITHRYRNRHERPERRHARRVVRGR
jgi:hypothetical protein